MEAPKDLEELIRSEASRTGVDIQRDAEVELTLLLNEGAAMIFVIFWPSGAERLNLLAPKTFAGRSV